MKVFDYSFPTPQENLACDEALMEELEEGRLEEGVLRFWESKDYFVVLGYSNRLQSEVDPIACGEQKIEVLRRCSGGGTVLQGPGCLNYSLIMNIEEGGPTSTITGTNSSVMENHRAALEPEVDDPVQILGHTDLALNDLKFSGNSQRRKRKTFLFHGTFLYGFDIAMMGRWLKFPSRQPEYRKDRPHESFLTNLKVPAGRIKKALAKKWKASEPLKDFPSEKIAGLAQEKYQNPSWNHKF